MKIAQIVIVAILLCFNAAQLRAEECGALGFMMDTCNAAVIKIISAFSNTAPGVDLTDDEMKLISGDGVSTSGYNYDGATIDADLSTNGGKITVMAAESFGGEWGCYDVDVTGNHFAFKETPKDHCGTEPPPPETTVYCHCDPEGHTSMDYPIGQVTDTRYTGKLCSQCNNDFCRKKTGWDHIKKYACRVGSSD